MSDLSSILIEIKWTTHHLSLHFNLKLFFFFLEDSNKVNGVFLHNNVASMSSLLNPKSKLRPLPWPEAVSYFVWQIFFPLKIKFLWWAFNRREENGNYEL